MSGTGFLFRTDGAGTFTLVKASGGLPATWKQVVPVRVEGPADCLLALGDGKGTVLQVDESGGLVELCRIVGLRGTHFIPGRFGKGPDAPNLLSYDWDSGELDLWTIDRSGSARLIHDIPHWRPFWNHLVPGFFLGSMATLKHRRPALVGVGASVEADELPDDLTHRELLQTPDLLTDLFCCDERKGVCEYYTIDHRLNVAPVHTTPLRAPRADVVVSGNFCGDARYSGWWTDLLFYERPTTFRFYSTDQRTLLSGPVTETDRAWDIVAPGYLLERTGPERRTDVLLYSSGRTLELHAVTGEGGMAPPTPIQFAGPLPSALAVLDHVHAIAMGHFTDSPFDDIFIYATPPAA